MPVQAVLPEVIQRLQLQCQPRSSASLSNSNSNNKSCLTSIGDIRLHRLGDKGVGALMRELLRVDERYIAIVKRVDNDASDGVIGGFRDWLSPAWSHIITSTSSLHGTCESNNSNDDNRIEKEFISIYLSKNNATRDGFAYTSYFLLNQQMIFLKELHLDHNPECGSSGMKMIAHTVCNTDACSKLEVLNMGYDHVGDVGANFLVGAWICTADEAAANIANNVDAEDDAVDDDDDEHAMELQAMVSPTLQAPTPTIHNSLKCLVLSGNHIGLEGFLSIACILRHPSCHLQTLRLNSNWLFANSGAIHDIAQAIQKNNRTLTTLDLRGNGLSTVDVKQLINAVYDTTSLVAMKECNHVIQNIQLGQDDGETASAMPHTEEYDMLEQKLEINRGRSLVLANEEAAATNLIGTQQLAMNVKMGMVLDENPNYIPRFGFDCKDGNENMEALFLEFAGHFCKLDTLYAVIRKSELGTFFNIP